METDVVNRAACGGQRCDTGAGGLLTSREWELGGIIDAYNAVTERLKQSHDVLTQQVKRLRAEVRHKDRELARRERLAALGEMAAGVAHEVRNPLGGILLYANLLQRDLAGQKAPLRVVGQIVGAVQKVERVVGDVLAFAGDRRPRRRPTELRGLIGAVVDALDEQRGTGCAVHVGEREDGVVVEIDPALMERALSNVVANAMEAAGDGGNVWIDIEESERPPWSVCLRVADDGPGVPAGDRDRIFNPFYTTKDGGTGLGLAITHRVVESHGGRVTVGDRAGGGAEFVMWLARGGQEVGERDGGTKGRRNEGTKEWSPPERIRDARSAM